MPLVVKDLVKETTTTTGTGTVTLAGAASGYQSFSAIGDGNTTFYCINLGSEWEVGLGTYTASGTTLSRDVVFASSNSGSAVNFSAGTKEVFCTYPAGTAVYTDGSGSYAAGSLTVSDSIGWRGMPQNAQSAAYTLAAGDAGKTIVHPASDNNARTFTIPANASVAFPIGTTITFINMINTVTISITSDTLYQAGSGATGSRTLSAYGVATAVKVGSTGWIISGNGLT
jgi:hypothetical protein